MTGAWYRGIRPVRALVECEGEVHEVLWRRGALVLLAHDGADIAVAGLGGGRPACLDVLRSWRRGHVEASLHDPLPHAAGLVTGVSSLGRWLTGDDRDPVPPLPPVLRRLRELSMVATWRRGARALGDDERDEAARRVVDAAVTARVREVVEPATAALASSLRAGRVTVDVGLAPSPFASGSVDDGGIEVVVRMPASWLYDVWLPGAAAASDGSLVVATRDGLPSLVAGWRSRRGRWVFAIEEPGADPREGPAVSG